MRALVLAAASVLFVASTAGADVYQWVDEDGRTHFSNREPDSSAAPTPPPSGPGEGWESMIERQEGLDEFSQRAEAVINSLTVDLRREKRERDRARQRLEKTQREIVRLQELRQSAEAYALRPREAQEIVELQRIESRIAQIESNIERVRAIKAMGREQAERQLGRNPFFQYGQ